MLKDEEGHIVFGSEAITSLKNDWRSIVQRIEGGASIHQVATAMYWQSYSEQGLSRRDFERLVRSASANDGNPSLCELETPEEKDVIAALRIVPDDEQVAVLSSALEHGLSARYTTIDELADALLRVAVGGEIKREASLEQSDSIQASELHRIGHRTTPQPPNAFENSTNKRLNIDHAPTPEKFFAKVERLVSERADELLTEHERRCWPEWLRHDLSRGLKEGSREHWVALLVLGAARSIGLHSARAHAGFLNAMKACGAWDVWVQAPPVHNRTEWRSAWLDNLESVQEKWQRDTKYKQHLTLFPSIYLASRKLGVYRRLITSYENRSAPLQELDLLLAPREDSHWSGSGTKTDSPALPIKIGVVWVLRELTRLSVLKAGHIYSDCWFPSARMMRGLEYVGMASVKDDAAAHIKSRHVAEFVKTHWPRSSQVDPQHLRLTFDIALRHQLKNEGLIERE